MRVLKIYSGGRQSDSLKILALFAGFSLGFPLVAQEIRAAAVPGFPTDWSHSHLIFTDGGSVQSQLDARQDPRAQMQWMRENLPLLRRLLPIPSVDDQLSHGPEIWPELFRRPRPPAPFPAPALHGDWNFSLQTNVAADAGHVDPTLYPAKYSFAPEGAANCSSDFVIFGLNVNGANNQANLIGVNNLYVGTTGFCGTVTNGGGSGTVPTPHVQWAYYDSGNPIASSLVLNLTGTKVAYVAGTGGNTSVHVVTLGAGTGTITIPTQLTSQVASVPLSNPSSNSSIFVDYKNDVGWVGDDNGHLYKITGIFNGTPTLATTLSPDTTNCQGGNGVMSSPVYDSVTDTVFVACKSGFIYAYKSASGTPVAVTGSVQLAFSNPGIAAPPIVDSTNHVLYAFYGQDVTNKQGQVAQVVYTANPTFSSSATTSLTTAGTNRLSVVNANNNVDYMAVGAFSRSYFSGFSSSTSFLYTCGPNAGSNPTGIALQQVRFNPSRIMSAIANVATFSNTLNPNNMTYCSPITHFFNSNTSTDYLFLSVPPITTGANVFSFNITNNTAGGALTPSASATVSGGTYGIVVDGGDPSNQASSIYFSSKNQATNACSISSGSPAGNVANPTNTAIGSQANADCAYKLTQSGLQ